MEQETTTSGGAGFRASYLSRSPEETEEIAYLFAPLLEEGDLILAFGGLGAGKTCFARGLARGLGVLGEVASPSFTYLREHRPKEEGGPAFYHFDCYRLHDADEWFELGFDEYLGGHAVSYIEWPERVLPSLPSKYIAIFSENTDNPRERIFHFVFPEQDKRQKGKMLEEALAAFVRVDVV